jgi:hypothetical protein
MYSGFVVLFGGWLLVVVDNIWRPVYVLALSSRFVLAPYTTIPAGLKSRELHCIVPFMCSPRLCFHTGNLKAAFQGVDQRIQSLLAMR